MSKKEDISKFIYKKINYLQLHAEYGDGKAMLAKLRKGVGHEPGELPELFGIILLDMPDEFMSRNGKATKAEWACYVSLTLYALHHQGHNVESQQMHTLEKISIGSAMSKLVSYYDDANAEQRMLQRLQTLSTSVDMKELSYHMRSIIQLLKNNGIPLNYGILAADLYDLQFSERKKYVHLRWGQDFYRRKNKNEEDIVL